VLDLIPGRLLRPVTESSDRPPKITLIGKSDNRWNEEHMPEESTGEIRSRRCDDLFFLLDAQTRLTQAQADLSLRGTGSVCSTSFGLPELLVAERRLTAQ